MEALKAFVVVAPNTLLTALVVACFVQLPLQIAMIATGVKYKDECPVENMIPIYLIMGGAAGIFANFCSCGIRYNDGDKKGRSVNPLQAVVQVILLAWFTFGYMWIYEIKEPNYTDPNSTDFCNKTLFLFAAWVTTTYYIIFGIMLLVICLVGVCMSLQAQE